MRLKTRLVLVSACKNSPYKKAEIRKLLGFDYLENDVIEAAFFVRNL